MNTKILLAACGLVTAATSFAGEPAKNPVGPEPADQWSFQLAIPGWLAGLEGDVGVNGLNSHINLDGGDVFRHYDLAVSLRGEARRGKFGVSADLLYTSLSDGIGTDTVVKKLDLQVDQTIGELAVSWRILEGPKGYLDAVAGVRYVNLFQQVVTQPNDEKIEAGVERFGDEFGDRVRQRLDDVLSEGKFRNALSAAVKERITTDIDQLTGANPREQNIPNAPLAARHFRREESRLMRLVERRAREVVQAAAADAKAAARAEVAATQATIAAERARARKLAQELRERVNLRIAKAKANLEEELEENLHNALDHRAARTDDWWDPIIGLRARYNFNDRFYMSARGDIGGFGVGSDLTWQAEGAFGWQVTRNIFAELGYRALSIDYDHDGLTYDVLMHGAQMTVGIAF